MSTEEAVGILSYANSLPGFRGILKQRLVFDSESWPVEVNDSAFRLKYKLAPV